MTFLKYLKDRYLIFIGWLVLSLLLVLMVWLTPEVNNFWDNLFYLLVLQFFFLLVFLAIDYYRKKPWYDQFQSEESLQHFIEKAQTNEEKLLQNYLNQQVSEHHQTLEQVVTRQSEQKDYMDSWIHEIKVPLAAVDLLLQRIEFEIDDREFVTLQNEVQKIDEYVEQVLFYSRSDEFINDYLIQEYSLKKIIQPIISSQANYFIQNSLQLEMPENDAKVLTDSKWFGFIFRQLLSNAIKYTPANGKITIEIVSQAQGVTLKLSDTGIGIPKEDLGRIFDKGFTGENGRSAQQHSTGIGLYLAKSLSQKLGVELSATSQQNVGTTMALFFPQLSYFQEER